MIVFLVGVSDCGMDPPPPLPPPVTPGDVGSVLVPAPLQTEDELRLKFQDDTLMAECVSLRNNLVDQDSYGPWQFHEQSGKQLKPGCSILQKRLNDL